jgi:hypothetical protein
MGRVCEDMLSYLSLSRTTVAGWTYGSERMLIHSEGRNELHMLLSRRYMERYGEVCSLSMEVILDLYSQARKKNFETLRDGEAIRHSNDTLSLFPETADIEETNPVATVYAYWGHNARRHRCLVKIGYTTQDLRTYLKSKEIAHQPFLFGTRCGGRTEEKAEHARWARYKVHGTEREWFYPTHVMFAAFRIEWQVTADFEKIVEEALSLIG